MSNQTKRAIQYLQDRGWRIAMLGKNKWLINLPHCSQNEMDDEQLVCLAIIYEMPESADAR